jgi:hypothetical protein
MESVVLTRTIMAVLSGMALITLFALTASIGQRRPPGTKTTQPGLEEAAPAYASARGRQAHQDAIQRWVRSLHPT